MHQFAAVWRVGDNSVDVAVMVACQRILAGCDVAAIGATQTVSFEMSHQIAVAAAWLGKTSDAGGAEIRDQRLHRLRRRRVEIARNPLEVATLAHNATRDVPGIHFTRPTVTNAPQNWRNGAACCVCAQAASNRAMSV